MGGCVSRSRRVVIGMKKKNKLLRSRRHDDDDDDDDVISSTTTTNSILFPPFLIINPTITTSHDVPSIDASELTPNIPSLRDNGCENHTSSVHPVDMVFQSSPIPVSSKMHVERPIAGSQVAFCPIDKRMLDSWSHTEPQAFRVRGKNYLRDKRKEHASNYAAYYPCGVDVFLSERKIHHISRFVQLPAVGSSSEQVPSVLVVNVQIPLYPASFFKGEIDGEGISFVLYFKLSDRYSKELYSQFQDNMRRILDDELEKVKGFPLDTLVPCRERLKILGRIVNLDDLQLSAPERTLMHALQRETCAFTSAT